MEFYMSLEQVSNAPTQDLTPNGRVPVWQRFHSSLAKDLAWVIFSRPIVYGDPQKQLASNELWGLPDNQAAILEFIGQVDAQPPKNAPQRDSRRLGAYYEHLLAFALEGLSEQLPYHIVTKNLQIRCDKRTLGEADFLLQHRNGDYLHLEVAVKFYLLAKRRDARNFDNWIGPNAKDRLGKKYRHLCGQQLRLFFDLDHRKPLSTNTPQGAAFLADLPHIRHRALHSRYLMPGMLFIHWNQQQWPIPEHINSDIPFGHWLHCSEFNQWLDSNGEQSTQLQRLQKTSWLSGLSVADTRTTETSVAKLVDADCPRMYSRYVTDRAASRETRLVVVPDYWPDTNSPSRKI